MNASFRMMVAAALSLILSFPGARAGAASVKVVAAAASPAGVPVTAGAESLAFQFGADLAPNPNRETAAPNSSGAVALSNSSLSAALNSFNGDEASRDRLASTAGEKAGTTHYPAQKSFTSIVNEVPTPNTGWQLAVAVCAIALLRMKPKLPTLVRLPVFRLPLIRKKISRNRR